MTNQLVPYSNTTEVIENASRFAEFLSSDTVAPVRTSITIIPNIIKDFLNIALEHKQLKIQDKQFRRKIELAQQYLGLQERDSQRKNSIELEKIRVHAEVSMSDINLQREVGLAKIESDKQTQLRRIKSEESVQIANISSQYQIALKRQEKEKELFQKALRESNYRFNRQTKNAERVQAEFSHLIRVITDKMVRGRATVYECKLLEHLALLKAKALETSFDISEEFLSMFSRGD